MNQYDQLPKVHAEARLITWKVSESQRFVKHEIPWGLIWLENEGGGGQTVSVEATEAFELILYTETSTFVEFITPGRHNILLTNLDRTDVRSADD